MNRNLSFIRDAEWLGSERVRVYCLMVCAAFAAMFLWIIFSHPFIFTKTGDPLGGDFVSFYAASKLALSGHAADAWHPALHAAAEDSLFKGPHGYLAFFYPPPYLLICWPLALLPYPVALLTWIVLTLAAALAGVKYYFRTIAPDVRAPILVLIAYPAVWINMGCGQNGALTLAIFTLGFSLLDKRPIVAGLALGFLVIKPQLAIVLPFVFCLAALARPALGKTIFAGGMGALGLCLVSLLIFGTAGFTAFLQNSTYARETLNRGLVDPAIMQSTYAALRLLRVPMGLAYVAQGLVSSVVLTLTCYTAFTCKPNGPALGALIVSATLLVTPFLLDYDLLIAALPMGWLVMSGARSGSRPWEKLIVLLVFILPLFSRKLAMLWHLPIAPIVVLALFACVLGRVWSERSQHATQGRLWQTRPEEALP